MLVADRFLLDHTEVVVECRGGESLAPHALLQRFGKVERQFTRFKRAVGVERATQMDGRQRFPRHGLEDGRESRKRTLVDRQAGGECMPAESANHTWRAFRDEIEPVAQMKSIDRSP